jgi:biopolymer transport protein TolQ
MFSRFFSNSIWQLVTQSDVVSKLVLFTLFITSIICWSIFIYKIILFKIKRRQILQALQYVNRIENFNGLFSVIKDLEGTLPGYFIKKNIAFLRSIITIDSSTQKVEIESVKWDLFLQHIDQSIEEIIYNEQSYLSFLSTSAVVSPLLGLFGTVWGLVQAFISISQKRSADIAAVAPGIAEALITTLAGLAVAVPALVMFNYCSSKVREIDQLFTVLSDKLVIKIQKYAIK